MPTNEPQVLKLPDQVVYYNQWTNFDNREIADLFECIPYEELETLGENTTIWLNSEEPSGKVYGYKRAEVLSTRTDGNRVRIEFEGRSISGRLLVEKTRAVHEIHRCIDLARLVELVEALPLATEAGSALTISEESRAYLESIGKTLQFI